MQRFIRLGELASSPARNGKPARAGRWPASSSTVWRWVQNGLLDAPVKLGPQMVAWPIETIERFEEARVQAGASVEQRGQRIKAGQASAAVRRARRDLEAAQ